MPKLFMGNFREMVASTDLPPDFAAPNVPGELPGVIERDIPRTRFTDLRGNDYRRFTDFWQDAANNAHDSMGYVQGIMDAGFFPNLIFTIHIAQSNELGEMDFYRNNYIDFRFAYFNDQNVPCGFCIGYLPANSETNAPEKWVLSIIENTVADPENRHVTIIGSETMLKQECNETLEPGDVFEKIKQALKSELIEQRIGPIFVGRNILEYHSIQCLKVEADKCKLHDQLDELESSVEYNQTFWQRNRLMMIAGIASLLVIAALAMLATGVLAPIGLLSSGFAAWASVALFCVVGTGAGLSIASTERSYNEIVVERINLFAALGACNARIIEIDRNWYHVMLDDREGFENSESSIESVDVSAEQVPVSVVQRVRSASFFKEPPVEHLNDIEIPDTRPRSRTI